LASTSLVVLVVSLIDELVRVGFVRLIHEHAVIECLRITVALHEA
jgi:hypothetical protein